MGNLFISELLSPEDMRRVCAQTGAGVELIQFSIADNLDDPDGAIRSVRQALASYDATPELTVHGPFLDLNPATWDSCVLQATRLRFSQAYDAARVVGAKKVVFHTGFYPHANFLQGWLERAVDFFRAFMKERNDLEVVLENLFDPLPEPLLTVYEGVAHPRFKLCLDIGHAHCYSRVPVTEWAKKLLPALGHIHVHDNRGFDPLSERPDQHLALGAGTMPLDDVFAALRARPDLTYTIECNTPEDALRSWARLKAEGLV